LEKQNWDRDLMGVSWFLMDLMGRDRQIDKDRERERGTEREKERERERHGEGDTERERETERDRFRASTTFRSISGFALPSMHPNNLPLLQLSYL